METILRLLTPTCQEEEKFFLTFAENPSSLLLGMAADYYEEQGQISRSEVLRHLWESLQ